MAEYSEEERDAAIERIVERIRGKLKKDYKPGIQPIDQIERQAQEIGEELTRVIEEETIGELKGGFSGNKMACPCGATARYRGMRPRRIVTRGGVHCFPRAYYYCSSCHSGLYPLDAQLDLGRSECTRQVRALAARFCSYLPFRMAAGELAAICGICLSVSTLERYALEVGNRVREEWCCKERLVWEEKMAPGSYRPDQLHVSMDGVIIFVEGDWREAKLGVVYERDGAGAKHARYYATLEGSSCFGRKMRTLAQQGGADRCRKLGVVADGGVWIWKEVGKYFPTSVQILDYYHLTQHLWEAAHAQFGEGSDAAKEWMGFQEQALLADRSQEVLDQILAWRPRQAAAGDIRRKLIGYLSTHAHRMRYSTFQKEGWHIGSGVMESGCKCVVKARMGGAGMRWSQEGAEAMLHLCAHWRSYGASDFRQYA